MFILSGRMLKDVKRQETEKEILSDSGITIVNHLTGPMKIGVMGESFQIQTKMEGFTDFI